MERGWKYFSRRAPNHCALGDRLDGLDRYREKQRIKTILTQMLRERAANRSVIAKQAKEIARKDQQIEELEKKFTTLLHGNGTAHLVDDTLKSSAVSHSRTAVGHKARSVPSKTKAEMVTAVVNSNKVVKTKTASHVPAAPDNRRRSARIKTNAD